MNRIMKTRWEVKKGETPENCAIRNLSEIVDALIQNYVPNWKTSLAYDDVNDELFISEPYTTGERLPYQVLYTFENESYDIEEVILDESLKPDETIEEDGMIVRAGLKAYEEILADELYLFLAENL